MKVTLINHSDTRGGASVVTYRLMQALQAEGVDARMLVVHKSTDDAAVKLVGSALSRKACFLAEHARIFACNGFSRRNLFKISIATDGLPLWRHRLVQDADVVILNWINQGMLSLKDIERIAAIKPVLWTMHDMWCLTGVCHHAGKCKLYSARCGHCPLVLDGRKDCDLSRSTWLRKQKLYAKVPIHFVAVSSWLADKCKVSNLMKEMDVSVIPNAFPIENFPARARKTDAPRRIVMGAARLDDPIKDLPTAIDALNIVHKQSEVPVEAVFFGDIRDASLLDRLQMPYSLAGKVSAMEDVARIYADATVVLSTSLYETLPGTIVEGMSAGCTAVATDSGGQRDIIDQGVNGYLAPAGNAQAIADAVLRAINAPFEPESQHQAIANKFSAQSVAHRYIELIKKIIDKR